MTARDAIRRLAAFRVGRSGAAEGAALVLFGLFLATIAPFGTAEAPTPLRYLYWQLAMVGGGVIAALIEPVLARRLESRPRLFVLAQLTAMTPAIAVWVSLLPVIVFGARVSGERILQVLPNVLTINVAVVVLAWLTRKALNRSAARPAPPEGLAPPVLRAKLPPRLARARLVAVEAEDHYLRIRTEAGSALVLMRLDLDGPPHRNPDDEEIPCPHLHIYREGYGDKWAIAAPLERYNNTLDLFLTFEAFMTHCNITGQPQIEKGLFS